MSGNDFLKKSHIKSLTQWYWKRNILVKLLLLPLVCIAIPIILTITIITKDNWNKKARYVGVIAIWLPILVGYGVYAYALSQNDGYQHPVSNAVNSPVVEESVQVKPTQEDTDDSPEIISFTEFPAYSKDDQEWFNIHINPESTEEQVLELAKDLHRSNPHQYYRIFDSSDADSFNEYMLWDINYPSNAYPYPEWGDEHYIGTIQEMIDFDTGKWKWVLMYRGMEHEL